MTSLAHNLFRRVCFVLALAAPAFAPYVNAQAPAPSHGVPVLVELFTSEGCSDCPPADALLAQLDATQPVPGAQAIVLSEHVTYWNHEGWTDPFSLDAMTDRQRQYVQQLGADEAYTPQIVVDGAEQFTGSDNVKLARALIKAAAVPKIDIQIESAHRAADGSVDFSVHAPAGTKATVVGVLAESATRAQVVRGENKGRTLHHVAVVRVLKEFDSKAIDGRPLRLPAPERLTAGTTEGPPRLVVFLVSRKNGHVVGAAEQTLSQ
ncbi:MAG: DUF1223 domain-containing protein [Terracidiphilus sp.]